MFEMILKKSWMVLPLLAVLALGGCGKRVVKKVIPQGEKKPVENTAQMSGTWTTNCFIGENAWEGLNSTLKFEGNKVTFTQSRYYDPNCEEWASDDAELKPTYTLGQSNTSFTQIDFSSAIPGLQKFNIMGYDDTGVIFFGAFDAAHDGTTAAKRPTQTVGPETPSVIFFSN